MGLIPVPPPPKSPNQTEEDYRRELREIHLPNALRYAARANVHGSEMLWIAVLVVLAGLIMIGLANVGGL